MKNIRYTILVCILLFSYNLHAQQQYKFAFRFDRSIFDSTNLEEDVTPDSCQPISGYLVQPDGTKYLIHKYVNHPDLIPMLVRKNGKKLKGIIDYREDDILYMHFWYFTKGDKDYHYVDSKANDKGFLFTIPWTSEYHLWPFNWTGTYHYVIPFTFHCFTATNIPVKYDLNTGLFDPSLLNFSLVYFWCRGRRKFFKNTDIQPRDEYWGFGPYLGFFQTQNDNTVSQFAITYGGSWIYGDAGLNVIYSLGLANGLTKSSHGQFYTGIGLGFNLVSNGGTGTN